MKYQVVFTESFSLSFSLAIEYIRDELGSPIASVQFQSSVLELIVKTSYTPTIAVKRFAFEGVACYVISHKEWNIYYSLEDNIMKVLDLVHQRQSSSF